MSDPRKTSKLSASPIEQSAAFALLDYVRRVHDTFKRDIEAGYKTKDKEFAVDLLGKALNSAESTAAPKNVAQFLSDVVTAAGLLSYGRTDKALAKRISDCAYEIREAMFLLGDASPAPAPADERAAPDVPEKRHATDPEQQWQQFWREICTNADGSINLEQVKKELSDFSMLLSWVPRVYMHVTGGMVSKENTWPSVVISLHDEHVNELIEEALRSELEDRTASATETEAEGAKPYGWASPGGGHYFTRNETVAKRIGGLIPIYLDPSRSPARADAREGLTERKIADVVNSLRDIAILFHDAQQLRERIAGVVVPLLTARPGQPEPSVSTLVPCPVCGGEAVGHIDMLELVTIEPEPRAEVMAAVRDVLAERRRQIEQEGWTPEHDDKHNTEEMAIVAACYAESAAGFHHPSTIPHTWPWDPDWWKPTTPRRDLVKAGALILAELERLDRAATRAGDA